MTLIEELKKSACVDLQHHAEEDDIAVCLRLTKRLLKIDALTLQHQGLTTNDVNRVLCREDVDDIISRWRSWSSEISQHIDRFVDDGDLLIRSAIAVTQISVNQDMANFLDDERWAGPEETS